MIDFLDDYSDREIKEILESELVIDMTMRHLHKRETKDLYLMLTVATDKERKLITDELLRRGNNVT